SRPGRAHLPLRGADQHPDDLAGRLPPERLLHRGGEGRGGRRAGSACGILREISFQFFMRFGIIGTGKMGGEIETAAAKRGHDIVWRLSSRENPSGSGITAELVSGADVVFEFTSPAAAVDNLMALAKEGARTVCGTTGWGKDLPRVTEAFVRGGGA